MLKVRFKRWPQLTINHHWAAAALHKKEKKSTKIYALCFAFPRPCLHRPQLKAHHVRTACTSVVIRWNMELHRGGQCYQKLTMLDKTHWTLHTHAIVSMLMSSEGSKEPLMIWKQMQVTFLVLSILQYHGTGCSNNTIKTRKLPEIFWRKT